MLLLLALGAIASAAHAAPMSIKEYVNLPDPTYTYNVTEVIKHTGFSQYNILLTSGQWLTANDSSAPVWKHWMQVCVPEIPDPTNDVAFIYIDGSGTPNPNDPPGKKWVNPPLGVPLCVGTGSMTIDLTAVPNEHITFNADPIQQSRTEDAIIAYTWRMFLGGAKPEWLLRYPMTRSVVRAMDAAQDLSTKIAHLPNVNKFIVGGASKRGWTTWTTAIVDPRVIACVPIVAPIGNLQASINEHYRMYGGWSFALADYLEPELDLMSYLNNPKFKEMMDLVGIDNFQAELGRMPKLVITASMDEFFIPTSPRFFWDDLQGEKLLRTVPNAEHSLIGHEADLLATVMGFYTSVTKNHQRPVVEWTVSDTDGSISANVTAGPLPEKVHIFHATNDDADDFRVITCNPKESGGGFNASCINPTLWWPKEIQPVTPGTGHYVASMPAPPSGYTAFMIQMEFKIGGVSDFYAFKATTAVSIVPLTPPYPACGENCNKTPGPFPPSSQEGATLAQHVARVPDGDIVQVRSRRT